MILSDASFTYSQSKRLSGAVPPDGVSQVSVEGDRDEKGDGDLQYVFLLLPDRGLFLFPLVPSILPTPQGSIARRNW